MRLGEEHREFQNYVERNCANSKYDKGNPRPFLHFFFNRFAFVLTEESFARPAKGVDTASIARLHQYANDGNERGESHKPDKYAKDDFMRRAVRVRFVDVFGGSSQYIK